MGSSMVSSHFANRQSGKETIKKSSVPLENGETTICDTTSDSLNGYDEKSRLEGNLALNTVPETNELPKKVKLANTGFKFIQITSHYTLSCKCLSLNSLSSMLLVTCSTAQAAVSAW